MAEIGVHARALPGLAKGRAPMAVWSAGNWYLGEEVVGHRICSIFRTIAEEAMNSAAKANARG